MSKGGVFERDISRLTSLWLTNGKDKDCIWRTKGSGSRATTRSKAKQKSSKYDFGDLAPDGPMVVYFFDVFSLELKTGYGRKNKKIKALWSILDILDGKQKTPTFQEFWEQATNDAELSKRIPLLIFRRNNRESCIAMYDYIFDAFLSDINHTFNTMTVKLNDYPNIVVCNLNEFYKVTWGKVTEQFIKTKIKKIIICKRRGKI